MPKTGGLSQEFYIDGHDLGGDVGAINECASPRGVLEITGINKAAVERVMTHGDGRIEFASYFDDGTELSHNALAGLPTGDVVVLWAYGGAIGDSAAFLTAKQVNYDARRGQDMSLALTILCLGQGVALEYGEMLTAAIDTHSSASSSSSKDDAASTSAGLAAVVEIKDIDSGTPTIIIQDSPNDSSWSTLISFTAVASGNEPAAERKTVSGTVNRYLRVTTTGSFSNADFAIAYRRGLSADDVAY